MDARLVASRLPGIAMYGQPFNSPPFPGYLSYGHPDASAFYSPLAGENAEAWRAGITQAAAAAYYDPALAAHYGYGYGPMGLSDGARRKNATRETTSTLKAWLNEHRKNPYPTKGEKIMLAIITKMTLTQVSTWFANARRRLKKENKMTWSPRNRCGDEDDDDIMDGDDDNNLNNNSNNQSREGLSSSSHLAAGDTNSSRCSSPNPSNNGNGSQEGISRMSSFDLPHNTAQNPFMPRAELGGSFSIRGPNLSSGQGHSSDEGARNRNHGDDDEEIDLESVDEDRKDPAFIKRSSSSEHHSQDDNTRRPATSPSMRHVVPQNPLPGLFSNGAPHPSFQHGALNPAVTASLLARHHMQPHVLASMNGDPRDPPPRMHPSMGHHPSGFGPVPSKLAARRNSSSPHSHPYSRNAASSPTSSVGSSSSITSSPSKPKIWSLADVATSSEGSKNGRSENLTSTTSTETIKTSHISSPVTGLSAFAGRGPTHGLPQQQTPLDHDGLTQATIRNWMDGVMQQKMAAAAAAAMSGGQAPPPFFPSGLLPQHLAAALNPTALAVAASLPRNGSEVSRFHNPFPGFVELAAAQRAQMAAVAELQSHQTSPTPQPTNPSLSTSNNQSHPINASNPIRHRMSSVQDDHKTISPVNSPPHSTEQQQSSEVTGFNTISNRPDSSDSGIASAETSKDSLTQGNDSICKK